MNGIVTRQRAQLHNYMSRVKVEVIIFINEIIGISKYLSMQCVLANMFVKLTLQCSVWSYVQ